MVLESLLMLLTLAAPKEAPDIRLAPGSLLATASRPAYSPQERAVGNWRIESALSLEMSPIVALRQAIRTDATPTPRCVKLNNYWCVKHAGWIGEIASDPDGHVAFSTAEEGAAVAALLLKRYYLEFKRRTAREIATRWAPARCFVALASPLPAKNPTSQTSQPGLTRMLPQRPLPMGLAPHGLANTLRGRWLATHARGGALLSGKRPAAPRSGALDLAPAPEIAIGMGETPHKARGAPVAVSPEAPTLAPTTQFAPTPSPYADCSAEATRINNYASHIAEGVANGPDQDLALFDAQGQPTGNLTIVMANMAAGENGPLRVQPALVSHAVEQLRRSAAAETIAK
jgi:hypothetical protein